LSCGAIDPIALLLLYGLALFLLLIFWLLFSVFSALECMMEGGEASVVYADRTFATLVAATFGLQKTSILFEKNRPYAIPNL
jgi:hypothetical protein